MSELLNDYDEGFKITDDALADWALKKITEADAELSKMEDWYKSQLDSLKKQRDHKVEFLTGKLREYFESVPAKETKTMSKYSLPSGDLVLSKAKKDFAAENPAALLKWCVENDASMVKVEAKPKWMEIKKRLKVTDAGIIDSETGLVVDGVVELDKHEEFKVKTKEVN